MVPGGARGGTPFGLTEGHPEPGEARGSLTPGAGAQGAGAGPSCRVLGLGTTHVGDPAWAHPPLADAQRVP